MREVLDQPLSRLHPATFSDKLRHQYEDDSRACANSGDHAERCMKIHHATRLSQRDRLAYAQISTITQMGGIAHDQACILRARLRAGFHPIPIILNSFRSVGRCRCIPCIRHDRRPAKARRITARPAPLAFFQALSVKPDPSGIHIAVKSAVILKRFSVDVGLIRPSSAPSVSSACR